MSAVIIPTLCYKNASLAIKFLCTAFGFKEHLVHREEDGTIPHAQLLFGNAMIMLSSEKDNDFGKLVGTPNDHMGINTMSPYLILKDEDIEQHYEQAKAAGALIVYDLREESYGGKAYSCKDQEGYVWSFGSYDPWK